MSIPSNIAEGHGRMNPREFKHFLLIARGSNSELQTQLQLSVDLEFGDPKETGRVRGPFGRSGKHALCIARQVKKQRLVNNGRSLVHSFRFSMLHFFH